MKIFPPPTCPPSGEHEESEFRCHLREYPGLPDRGQSPIRRASVRKTPAPPPAAQYLRPCQRSGRSPLANGHDWRLAADAVPVFPDPFAGGDPRTGGEHFATIALRCFRLGLECRSSKEQDEKAPPHGRSAAVQSDLTPLPGDSMLLIAAASFPGVGCGTATPGALRLRRRIPATWRSCGRDRRRQR